MGHSLSKVQLGTTKSNIKEVVNKKGSVAAGLACRLKSDNTTSITSTDGDFLGVSLGKDLSNTDKNAVCVTGMGVPVQLEASFTPVIGAVVHIDNATGKAKASATDTTATAAHYDSTLITGGISEDGSTTNIPVAYINMPSGL